MHAGTRFGLELNAEAKAVPRVAGSQLGISRELPALTSWTTWRLACLLHQVTSTPPRSSETAAPGPNAPNVSRTSLHTVAPVDAMRSTRTTSPRKMATRQSDPAATA